MSNNRFNQSPPSSAEGVWENSKVGTSIRILDHPAQNQPRSQGILENLIQRNRPRNVEKHPMTGLTNSEKPSTPKGQKTISLSSEDTVSEGDSVNSSDILPVNVKSFSKQVERKEKANDGFSKKTKQPASKKLRPTITPLSTPALPTSETGGENPITMEKEVPPPVEPTRSAALATQSLISSDVPISVEGLSVINKSKKPTGKKVSEGTKITPPFHYKGKAITTEQSAFESCGVAFNLVTQATLPKDDEVFHKILDHDLKRDGFYSLLMVEHHFTHHIIL